MSISLEIKTQAFIKKLGKKTNQLQIVAADTLNYGTAHIERSYKKKLRKNSKLRSKFTLNSVKKFKANPVSRSGEPRPLHRINSVVGIRKLKGGKEHYLAKRENTKRTRGNPLTMGKVPIPLKDSRIGQSDDRPISSPNRLNKGKPQTLKLNGKKIGVRGDGFKSNKARWRTLYLASGKGKKQEVEGKLTKPFFMITGKGNLGVYKKISGKIEKIRNLDKSSVTRKGKPDFKRSVDEIKPRILQKLFIKNAKKKIKG